MKIEIMYTELKDISEKLDKIIMLLENRTGAYYAEDTSNTVKRFIRVKNVANYLGVSKSTIYCLTSEKRIPHKKIVVLLYFFERLD